MKRPTWMARPALRRFLHVTFPLLANLYLVCTLLGMLFTMGDFSTVYFVSGGGPAKSTQVLATLGVRDAFVMSAAAAWRGGGDVGDAGSGPAGDDPDAAACAPRRWNYERDHVDTWAAPAHTCQRPRRRLPAAALRGRGWSAAARPRPGGLVGGPDLQHGDDRAGRARRRVQHAYLSADADAGQLLDRGERGLLVPGVFLAPVRQQLLGRPGHDVPDAAHRLADQLRDRPHAHPRRLDRRATRR